MRKPMQFSRGAQKDAFCATPRFAKWHCLTSSSSGTQCTSTTWHAICLSNSNIYVHLHWGNNGWLHGCSWAQLPQWDSSPFGSWQGCLEIPTGLMSKCDLAKGVLCPCKKELGLAKGLLNPSWTIDFTSATLQTNFCLPAKGNWSLQKAPNPSWPMDFTSAPFQQLFLCPCKRELHGLAKGLLDPSGFLSN